MGRPSWDEYFMMLVYCVSARSVDPRTKVGAVVVGPDKGWRSSGYNSLPCHVEELPERLEAPEKYKWIVHAEQNAIAFASRAGTCLNGCLIYTNGTPCTKCAQSIIDSGIAEVIVHGAWENRCRQTSGYWVDDLKTSRVMLREAGVSFRVYDGPVRTEIPSLMRGVDVLRQGE